MRCRILVFMLLCGWVSSYPRSIPDKPVFVDGFKPVQGARGPSDSKSFESKTGRIQERDAPHGFSGGFSGNSFESSLQTNFGVGGFGDVVQGDGLGHGGVDNLGEPDKTIYVRLPQNNQGHQHAPKSAGPPQKHYRIVIIRSPTPAPVQPVIPPRTEQKTIIYVLHQKPKLTQQQVLETPVVKHPPQVLFVGYDDELSADDLKQLAEGNHEGFSVSSQQDAVVGGQGGGPGYSSNSVSGGNFGNNNFLNSQVTGTSDFVTNSQIQALQPFHATGDTFDGGVGGFGYNRRRSVAATPGRRNTKA